MAYKRLTRKQHFQQEGRKRILALDGGGLRGIVTLGYLKRVEDILRAQHGAGDKFRLAHYFDLIAGTSTGAIIAAGLALGFSVDELIAHYMRLGKKVFWKSRWRKGILRPRYSEKELTNQLKEIFGEKTILGDSKLKTGLLVVTKRLETGSTWPLGNNPKGKFYKAGPGDDWISNKDYPLWKVVRASTAAPSFFAPEQITISRKEGLKPVEGSFVDGGVSPFNNPSLQAFMYATLKGYRVEWGTGENKLLLVSVGTGRADPGTDPSWITAKGAVQSLLSLMDDSGALVETIVQWLSTSSTHREIDSDMGDLRNDFIGGKAQFTYARYDLPLTRESVDALKPGVSDDQLESLTEMDEPDNMPLLQELSEADADTKVDAQHFPSVFALK